MDILLGKLPDGILVNGVEAGIRTDFRIWLAVGRLFQASEELSVDTIVAQLGALVLDGSWPDGLNADDFVAAAAAFYAGPPRLVGSSGKRKEVPQRQPDFDFEADAAFVYSSFMSCYGIRLCEVQRMHWWEFLTLFEGLMFAEENAMSFVVGTRQTEMKDVSKSDKRRMGRLKREFALPVNKPTAAAQETLTSILAGEHPDNGDGRHDG